MMAMGQTKITVKVFRSLLAAFNKQLQVLPIKRDAFLNNVIRFETPRLSESLKGKKLSLKANRYISGELAKLGTTPVNIVVDKDVADALNKVVKQSNLVRDAFVNRLVAFLRASDELLNYLDLPLEHTGKIGSAIIIGGVAPTSPMKALEVVFSDPLWVLHEEAKDRYGTNLYMLDLPSPKWDGLACYMDEKRVPGTKAHKRETEEWAQFLETFELETLKPFAE
jgi:hypothetical protein